MGRGLEQGDQPTLVFGQLVERVADVLLGQQQGALVARQRGVGLRFDGAQAGPHVAQAERRPTDAGRQFEGARGAAGSPLRRAKKPMKPPRSRRG